MVVRIETGESGRRWVEAVKVEMQSGCWDRSKLLPRCASGAVRVN